LEERLLSEILAAKKVDGLIFIGAPAEEHHIAEVISPPSCPTVYVQRLPDHPHIDAVYIDEDQGSTLACEYLLKLGHHRIAIVTGLIETMGGRMMLEAFRKCMADADISLPTQYVIRGDFSLSSGVIAARQLLQCDPLPTAVFACNDLMAYSLIHTLAEAGLQIPDDISIIGFNDFPMSKYFYPKLTTVRTPTHQLGIEAARFLLERLDNPELPTREITLPVELVIRGSCRRH
jgi:LacI family transcriptional regulator